MWPVSAPWAGCGRPWRPARRRSSRTTSPGTSPSRRPTRRRGSWRGRSWRCAARARDLVCVQNKTVVTDAFKGEDLNHYVPDLPGVRRPGPLQLQARGHAWVRLPAQGADARARHDLPRGHPDPRLLLREEHRPPADGEVPHLHDDHRRDEERLRRAARTTTATTRTRWIHRTLVDLLAIQKEIHSGLFAVMDGTTAGNGPGPRTMFPVVKNVMLASADQVAIDAVAAKMMGFDPHVDRVHPGRARGRPRRRRPARHRDRRRRRTRLPSRGASRSATTARAWSATSCGSGRSSGSRSCSSARRS